MKNQNEKLTGERLAKAAVNKILENPECWNQSDWHSACGTKHCFGGWCQILSGKRMDEKTARADAAEALGLSIIASAWVFAAERTIADLYGFAANFAGYDRDGYDRDGSKLIPFDLD